MNPLILYTLKKKHDFEIFEQFVVRNTFSYSEYWVVSYHSILETIRGSFIDRMDIYGYFTFMSRSRNAFLRKPHELFGEMHPNLSIRYRYTVYNTRYFPKSSSNSQYVTGLVINL